jgi:CBS domain-containing protein
MNLGNISRRSVVTLQVNDHCRRAAELMSRLHIRHLPVVDEEVPVGMISERNLLSAIGWWGNSATHPDTPISDWAERLPAGEIMSSPVFCLAPDDPLDKGARLMLQKKISAIPLVGQGSLLGIVTETDFLNCCVGEEPWQRQSVLEHMTAHVFQVPPHEPIRSAWHLMRDKQIRHLAVTDHDTLEGVLSDRDLLAGISWDAAGPDGIQDRVRDIMTTKVAVIEPDGTLSDAALRMIDWKIGALPVVDHGRLTGIITETDLLKVLVRELSES